MPDLYFFTPELIHALERIGVIGFDGEGLQVTGDGLGQATRCVVLHGEV